MKFLGIDYGTKRIGIAISDENHQIAFPKEVILNDKNTLEKISEILKKEKINEVVMGESLNFKGELNIVSEKINTFIFQLEKQFGVKIHREKEFLTSVEARKVGNTKMNLRKGGAHSKIKREKTRRADAGAAALILQRFLDRLNKNNLSR